MKLLITGALNKDEDLWSEIRGLGHEIVYVQDERIPLAKQDVSVSDIEGVICNGLFLYNPIENFEKLKYIQLTSAGLDRVPSNYIDSHHITLYNAKGVYSIPMAEFAVGGVLQIYKKTPLFLKQQQLHKWQKDRDLFELFEKNVCIIGCGSVGTECAKRFLAFGCNVIGVDINPTYDEHYSTMVGMDQLDNILPNVDIVLMALPLSKETHHLINSERLNKMKEGVVFVNIARGGLVDTNALIQNLPKLRGAVLDVFEEEPLDEDSPLWDMENVIIYPHNSYVGEMNQQRLKRCIISNLSQYKEE